ncbi:MAG TPA: ATP-dependent DNA ligase [Vicinamibacteria bacterium]|nr:ATP-dependent DNA ligase [Vicinamibacteria bacterium]
MKRFAALYEALDRTTSTNAKVDAIAGYFSEAPPGDAAWALYFLTGRRLKRLLPSRVLWELVRDASGLPGWLLEHCYAAVGDFAEVTALLLETPAGETPELPLRTWVVDRILPLRAASAEAQRAALQEAWASLRPRERLVFNKLVTGDFRVGAAATLVLRALARVAEVEPAVVAHRVMGDWEPTAEAFTRFLSGADPASLQPYPFFLAAPLEDPVAALGDASEWLAEWKWDGIRAQALRRRGEAHLWSRGEELVTPRFPEIARKLAALPDGTVLDGEILAWRDGVLPFAVLQRRIGRLDVTPRALREAPVAFVAFDLLEEDGVDLRERPLAERRRRLESLLAGASGALLLSERVPGAEWPDWAAARGGSRGRGVEGLILKRLSSPYGAGRRRGDWWKWKIEPYTIDTVMTHAHPGHGKRASLYTDYTFSVWDGEGLAPVARAYSGLTDDEIRELDRWIRAHTLERHGPTRRVEPTQVFELGFEAIARSTRHRSGIAVRFPRILRWRRDKPAREAERIETLRAMLPPEPERPRRALQRRLPFDP